jgi:hypothetical protein
LDDEKKSPRYRSDLWPDDRLAEDVHALIVGDPHPNTEGQII